MRIDPLCAFYGLKSMAAAGVRGMKSFAVTSEDRPLCVHGLKSMAVTRVHGMMSLVNQVEPSEIK